MRYFIYVQGNLKTMVSTKLAVNSFNFMVRQGGKLAESLLCAKPVNLKNIIPSELGLCLPSGNINFQTEEAALKYIKTRLQDALKGSSEQQFERVIVKKGTAIIGEGDGTHSSATIAFQNISGLLERVNSDVPRDIEVFHSHPDMFGVGRANPLSSFIGDIGTFFRLKLKKFVAMNSKGEFNSIEAGENFSLKNFKMFESKHEEIYFSELITRERYLEFKRIANMKDSLLKQGKRLDESTSERYRQIMRQLAEKEREIITTEEVARINHKAYRFADEYGMHYETNFSNLLKYDA